MTNGTVAIRSLGSRQWLGKNSSLNDALQMPLARSVQRNIRLCFATDVGQTTCQSKNIICNASFIIKLQHLGLRLA